MHCIFGFILLSLFVAGFGNEEPAKEFSLQLLNQYIKECGPRRCLRSCACGPNHLYWTPCLDKKSNLPHGPKLYSCVNFTQLQHYCDIYDIRKCNVVDSCGTVVGQRNY